MIRLGVNNINQHLEYGVSWKRSTSVSRKTTPPVIVDFCFCDYECDYFEYAFHDTTNDWYKNDNTSFIVSLNDQAGSYEAKLIKGNDEFDINSNVATIYDFGIRKGALISWKKVFEEYGNGDYKIKVIINEFGQEIEKESHTYKVIPYYDAIAERTIKFESFNTGVIKNGFDYRGLRWYQSIRLFGDVKTKPVVNIDNYEDSERRLNNIQTQIREEYLMELDRMPSSVFRQLWNNDFLATEKRISNYKISAFEQYRRVNVELKSLGDPIFAPDKRTVRQEVIFDKKELILKQHPNR
jgi:hypothetical protein